MNKTNLMSLNEAENLLEQYWTLAREQDYVIDKVAWALYQTWKEADRRFNEWRGNEKR